MTRRSWLQVLWLSVVLPFMAGPVMFAQVQPPADLEVEDGGDLFFTPDPSPPDGTDCKVCILEASSGPMKVYCEVIEVEGTGGTVCEIKLFPDGKLTCEVKGTFCQVITVHG